MTLDLTPHEVEILEATLTTLSITHQHLPFDIYKDDYGKLLGKLLSEKER